MRFVDGKGWVDFEELNCIKGDGYYKNYQTLLIFTTLFHVLIKDIMTSFYVNEQYEKRE